MWLALLPEAVVGPGAGKLFTGADELLVGVVVAGGLVDVLMTGVVTGFSTGFSAGFSTGLSTVVVTGFSGVVTGGVDLGSSGLYYTRIGFFGRCGGRCGGSRRVRCGVMAGVSVFATGGAAVTAMICLVPVAAGALCPYFTFKYPTVIFMPGFT